MKRSIVLLWMLGFWLTTPGITASMAAQPHIIAGDSDSDGVDDANDLCPGTPAGTPVNVYGCPLSVNSCDFNSSTVTLAASGGSTGNGVSTRYVLADNQGTILQVSTSPSFSGLNNTATYMALSIVYEGAITNLSAGQSLSVVSAPCFDWSNALVFKTCPLPTTPCDYQIGDIITLQSNGGSVGSGVKTSYVLTNSAGKLIVVSSTPSFDSNLLQAGTYQAYALTYPDDNTISNLVANGVNTLAQVGASCLAVSSGLSITICGCRTTCVPLLATRIR
ncbi:hypothetical protein [Rudanella paleaurantiibacter]|uniref:hypothetical protein n=1 Tax=Rudanella paleaurantiibacter TaxID=2614655 RepID=UPI001624A240|nr:hypothetical protein [Rudanella paleaurantiibacter]